MNVLSLFALAASAGVLIAGLFLSTKNVSIFYDSISLFIVLGGTVAATSICFRVNKMFLLMKVFFQRILKDKGAENKMAIVELMNLSEAYRTNNAGFEGMIQKGKDPFLKDAMQSFVDQVLDHKTYLKVLESRAANMYEHHVQDAKKFNTVGKFPPAFGMMGTTIGMIVLLSNLAGADAAKSIGPSMSICLITTLYGVALANLFIIPIAENLTAGAKETYFKNMMIVEGVKLLYDKTNPVVLAEVLNSFMKPSERVDWKKVLNK